MLFDIKNYEGIVITKPNVPKHFINVVFSEPEVNGKAFNVQFRSIDHTQLYAVLPFSNSPCLTVPITSAKLLATGEDVKTVYELEFDTTDIKEQHNPGQTIGILPVNTDNNVQLAIETLGYVNCADTYFKMDIEKKFRRKILNYIPRHCTIRKVLKDCVDLNCIPKKLLLCALSEYTTNTDEKRFLEILCSKEGTTEYNSVFLNQRKNLMDILKICTSCRPPFNLLIEQLPRLMPRPYSIANRTTNKIKIIFSMNQPPGVTTSMLEEQANCVINNINKPLEIPIYLRQSTKFQYSTDGMTESTIMIASGTGIAPFLSFLDYRRALLKYDSSYCWLFFGCRYKDRDYLYAQQLQHYLKSGVLSRLSESFSRDENSTCKYVEDQIKSNSLEFVRMFLNAGTKTYVCGSRKMVQDVRNAIADCLQEIGGYSSGESLIVMLMHKNNGKYLEDEWE